MECHFILACRFFKHLQSVFDHLFSILYVNNVEVIRQKERSDTIRSEVDWTAIKSNCNPVKTDSPNVGPLTINTDSISQDLLWYTKFSPEIVPSLNPPALLDLTLLWQRWIWAASTFILKQLFCAKKHGHCNTHTRHIAFVCGNSWFTSSCL